MWDIRIRNGKTEGLHLCPHEASWMREKDGWAIVTFMFGNYFRDNIFACTSCKEKIPKEMINFFKLCDALCSDSSTD